MKIAVLISSCDAFNDCWAPMLYSLKRYWPDCPFPIYFISNYNKIDDPGIEFINVGKDNGFASNLGFALNKIDCDYIIYFQEDYFLSENVNTVAIIGHINHCYENNIDLLKIHGNDFLLRDQYRINDSDYCINPLDIRYSINTSVAIWKREILARLCVKGYSGWNWERNIISFIESNRIKINSEILHSSCYKEKSIITLPGGAVAKGRWTQNGVFFLRRFGFENVVSRREVEGKFITLLGEFYNHHPRSPLRFPIVFLLRSFLKLKINF